MESKELKVIHSVIIWFIYISVLLDIAIFIFLPIHIQTSTDKKILAKNEQVGKDSANLVKQDSALKKPGTNYKENNENKRIVRKEFKFSAKTILYKFRKIPIYRDILYSKLFTVFLIIVAAIGAQSKKEIYADAKRLILLPVCIGLLLIVLTIVIYSTITSFENIYIIRVLQILYGGMALGGTILLHTGFDNISKFFKSTLGKDKFNVENETFLQDKEIKTNPYSVNIPMKFYYQRKINNGWINIVNPFRGSMVLGTPGSGKSYGIINPFIKQLIAKGFTMLVYDFKDPDLGQIAYYHYRLNKKLYPDKFKDFQFHAINLNHVERSRRINPLNVKHITKLTDAIETATALIEALKKGAGEGGGGADQFFTQSAINFLSSVIYFFSKYENGKYSTLPHVLSLLNRSYEEIFTVLFSNEELASLLSPFASAFKNKSFNLLESQLGTLKINTSRLATKETFWVFSGDDVNLKFNDPKNPSIIVLANDPSTQNINSACYSVVLNRTTNLINSKGNLPSAIVIDEIPTLFFYQIENLIATARSNKVAVVIGLQELTQFKQQYGKQTAASIISVIGNVMAGAARDKETLEWLEKITGKAVQLGNSVSIDRNRTNISINERMDVLIPAAKIANLRTGEMIGLISQDADADYNGQFIPSAFNCKIALDDDQIANEAKAYGKMPTYYEFENEIQKNEILLQNFNHINQEIEEIIRYFSSMKKKNPSQREPEEQPKKPFNINDINNNY